MALNDPGAPAPLIDLDDDSMVVDENDPQWLYSPKEVSS